MTTKKKMTLKQLLSKNSYSFLLNDQDITDEVFFKFCDIKLKKWIQSPVANYHLIDQTIEEVFERVCWYQISAEESKRWIALSEHLGAEIEERIEEITEDENNDGLTDWDEDSDHVGYNPDTLESLWSLEYIVNEIKRSAPEVTNQG